MLGFSEDSCCYGQHEKDIFIYIIKGDNINVEDSKDVAVIKLADSKLQ